MDTTNHYRHPEMVPLMGRRAMTGSRRRAARVADLLRAVSGHEGWAEMQSILRDHIAPLCDHRPENATRWSVIADLSERRVKYARGQPGCTDYEPVEWPGPKIAQASPWYTPA